MRGHRADLGHRASIVTNQGVEPICGRFGPGSRLWNTSHKPPKRNSETVHGPKSKKEEKKRNGVAKRERIRRISHGQTPKKTERCCSVLVITFTTVLEPSLFFSFVPFWTAYVCVCGVCCWTCGPVLLPVWRGLKQPLPSGGFASIRRQVRQDDRKDAVVFFFFFRRVACRLIAMRLDRTRGALPPP